MCAVVGHLASRFIGTSLVYSNIATPALLCLFLPQNLKVAFYQAHHVASVFVCDLVKSSPRWAVNRWSRPLDTLDTLDTMDTALWLGLAFRSVIIGYNRTQPSRMEWWLKLLGPYTLGLTPIRTCSGRKLRHLLVVLWCILVWLATNDEGLLPS